MVVVIDLGSEFGGLKRGKRDKKRERQSRAESGIFVWEGQVVALIYLLRQPSYTYIDEGKMVSMLTGIRA